jgi:hypothetical protein
VRCITRSRIYGAGGVHNNGNEIYNSGGEIYNNSSASSSAPWLPRLPGFLGAM